VSSVVDLLRESKSKQEETLRCRFCGAELDGSAELCSNCDSPVKVVTLAEQGRRLPIGIIDDGRDGKKKLLKDFNLVKLNWDKEREVSASWKEILRRPDLNPLDYILCVLAHTVTDIGGSDFKKHNIEHRMHILGEMFAGDVFYMYAMLRVHSLGPEYDIRDIECPRCGRRIQKFSVDLSTLEVTVRDNPDTLSQKVALRYGFDLGGANRKAVELLPASFRVMAHSPMDDEAQFFAEILKSACSKIEGVEGAVLTDKEISQLEPYDLAKLREANDWLAGGINWSVDIVCDNERCGNKFNELIDWRHGSFFALSSRSRVIRQRMKS